MMNTGYRCPCGSRQTYAKLQKFTKNELEVELRCKKCNNAIFSDVDFFTNEDWDLSVKPNS